MTHLKHSRACILLVPLVVSLLVLSGLVPGRGGQALANASPADLTGTIAYVHNGNEIRLIRPDGSNDRSLWAMPPGAPTGAGISGLAWRPDGKELAFASNHEEICSAWQNDIYTIRSDGSGLRRVTNGPACAALAAYPQGSVTVEIENEVSNYSQFVVYMQGALEPQTIIVQPGSVVQVSFPKVADIGGTRQLVVAIAGGNRWFDPAVAPDVAAGGAVNAGRLILQGSATRQSLGALLPTWSPDGTKIGFTFGGGIPWYVPANAGPLSLGSPLLTTGVAGNIVSWSPVGDELLYDAYGGGGRLYRTTVGGDAGTQLAEVTFLYGLDWLPDGSGFIAADNEQFFQNSNLFLYDFATSQIAQITEFTNEYAGRLSLSPEGQYIAFVYSAQPGGAPPTELRLIKRDGSEMQTLASDADFPSWSRQAISSCSRMSIQADCSGSNSVVYLPFVKR